MTVQADQNSSAVHDIRLHVADECPEGGFDDASIGITSRLADLRFNDSNMASPDNDRAKDPTHISLNCFPTLGPRGSCDEVVV